MSGESEAEQFISELRLTRQGMSRLEDEVRRLADIFSKITDAQPVTTRREAVSPFAEAAGGLIDHLVNGARRKGKR